MAIDDKIKDIKDYGRKIQNSSNAYVNGAVAGGVIGVITAAVFKWKYVRSGFLGAIIGGYIGYKIAEEANKDLGLRKPIKKTSDPLTEQPKKFEVTEL